VISDHQMHIQRRSTHSGHSLTSAVRKVRFGHQSAHPSRGAPIRTPVKICCKLLRAKTVASGLSMEGRSDHLHALTGLFAQTATTKMMLYLGDLFWPSLRDWLITVWNQLCQFALM
jgi:hypothetical protein